jgi:hypothetical protein
MAAATGAMLSQCARRENPGLAMQKILVADVPQLDARLSGALGGRSLAFVRTLLEAERRLAAEEFGLVIIGLHFDDSRMFDLLRWARAQCAHIPFVCARIFPKDITRISIEGVSIAVTSLGAAGFIDVPALEAEHGHAEAAQRLRDTLLRQIVA